MTTPLILLTDGDILIFESREDAERYAEPVDVRNGEYIGWDSAGRKLEFAVEERPDGKRGSSGIERVRIRLAQEPSEGSGGAAELQRALIDFLSRTGVPAPADASLDEALAAAIREYGFAR